jgi:hypothetical protein
MVKSACETATSEIEFCVYQDDDDRTQLTFPDGAKGNVIVGPRITMSDYWNVLTGYANGDIFMLCGDDCVFSTPGWSQMVEDAFAACPDKILLVHGDDLGPNGKMFATHPFVHRRWVEVLGYFSGRGFSADYADAWPQDLATMIGRKKFLPFVHEHLHPVWGKAVYDEVYQETNKRLHRDNTPQLYANQAEERRKEAMKLQRAMNPNWKLE